MPYSPASGSNYISRSEVMKAGGKTIEVVRVRITEAGRKVIER
jgi:hypothetical protein